jgi:hypothetical protein
MRLSACPSALCVLLSFMGWAQEVNAHGNVVADEDSCVLKIGFYTAHFSAYQPRTREHLEFCEDLPDATETIFVLDYLHDSMRGVPVDLRILEDTQQLGRFARQEDIIKMDFNRDTVFYQPAVTQSDAVFTALHTFAEPGDYIGVVTALNPQQQKIYTAVFPFSVGERSWLGYLLSVIFVILIVCLGVWYGLHRHRTKTFGHQICMMLALPVLLGIVWSPDALAEPEGNAQLSQNGHFLVSYQCADEAIRLNHIHSWIVHVESRAQVAVEDAVISITGGMPLHDHGLSTEPRMTRKLGSGNYLIEGMRFHMPGNWQITVSVSTQTASDSAVFDLQL